jgi:hypothetical protein
MRSNFAPVTPFKHVLTVLDVVKTSERGLPWVCTSHRPIIFANFMSFQILQPLSRREWSDQAIAFALFPRTSLQANKEKQSESAARNETILVGLIKYGSEGDYGEASGSMHAEVRTISL